MSISIDEAIETMERQVEQYATPFDFFLRDALKELKDLRAKLAAIESQVPVGLVKTIGGYPDESEHRVDWLVKHHQLVDGQDLYIKPVPAGKPDRITEQDVRDIATSYCHWKSVGFYNTWFSEKGRELLNKLNADREQVPTVAVLVEALEEARLTIEVLQGRGNSAGVTLSIIDRALAAYRKGNKEEAS